MPIILHNHKKILFAPLDWGLGHASRCIPLIKEAQNLGHKVYVAANPTILALLKTELIDIQYLEIKGYNIRYNTRRWMLPVSILFQVPKILSIIRYEHLWLDQTIENYGIDIVFSDNRYGMYSLKCPCFFITHQLQIRAPQSLLIQRLINSLNHWYINKFTACLIPDYKEENMSGDLSKNKGVTNSLYMGNLSRFECKNYEAPRYHLLIILSGPEPQRSIFESMILTQLGQDHLKALLVRGKPESTALPKQQNGIQCVNHMASNELESVMAKADIIICRSGYSTIMDLIKLNKRAILIPTPGQTEQEYLAKYLSDKNWFLCIAQDNFDLHIAIERFKNSIFTEFPTWDLESYKQRLREILV